ncbi:hypothetical protein ACV344_34090 [Pseudomonas aeruginosa]|uniref:hypothetical protein n=1 Tax=Pseudomonas aeruginosa TaxID=287 RepID=UPI000E6A133D|nr:hypothetical protein [Pseudomonas aeruginosa]MBA5107676.1 hypothetical protein [Pseudomonas aeruginosa]MBD1300115.1 hypothetical protein [Pseudomonas aeruginosa]MBD1340680.1 hypothetical protein [Pseudomonas aeruginosa]MBG4604254.1 hypothetical protein [Pseudomonas aeruginosa]MBH3592858.1 hypothetical protein [Pseudomonas aeruginosa]
MLTIAQAVTPSVAHHSGGSAGISKTTYDQLYSRFGAVIPRDEVAKLLSYSTTYFSKRIGDKKLEHLPWVKALKPHRLRRGRRAYFKTKAVAEFLDLSGLDCSESR